MKKPIIILLMLVSAMAFNACGDHEDDNAWSRFYGYTKDDIVGHYEANPDEACYAPLPTEGVVVYRNVTIDITPLENNSVSLRIIIPDVINKVFTGAANLNENDSDLSFHNYNEDILFTVYKNDQNQVRLHGRERYCIYDEDHELVDCILHGFDVIKTPAN